MNMNKLDLSKVKKRVPILRDELRSILKVKNNNSFNQYIFMLLKLEIIKSYQKGIYYIPEKDGRFKDLEPSLIDIIKKKYCENYTGFRTGAALLNKYRFTSQVSSYYEIISSNVSRNTRNIKVFNDKVSVSASKVPINKNNYYYLIYAEILKNIRYSDYNEKDNKILLKELLNELKLNKKKLLYLLEVYKSNRLLYMHKLFEKVVNYAAT